MKPRNNSRVLISVILPVFMLLMVILLSATIIHAKQPDCIGGRGDIEYYNGMQWKVCNTMTSVMLSSYGPNGTTYYGKKEKGDNHIDIPNSASRFEFVSGNEGSLFLFYWNKSENKLQLNRYDGSIWKHRVTIDQYPGNDNFSLYQYKNKIVVVWKAAGKERFHFISYNLKYENFDSLANWTPEKEISIPFEHLSTLEFPLTVLSTIDNSYIGAESYEVVESAENKHYVVISISLNKENFAVLQMPLKNNGLPDENHAKSELWKWLCEDEFCREAPILKRDPAGRIRAYYLLYDYIVVRILSLDKPESFQWSEAHKVLPDKVKGTKYVSGAGYLFSGNNGNTVSVSEIVMIVTQGSTPGIMPQKTSVKPGESIGMLEKIQASSNLSDIKNGGKKVLIGIIDGPPPIPIENVLIDGKGKSKLTYGTEKSKSSSSSISSEKKFGLEASVGISENFGYGSVSGEAGVKMSRSRGFEESETTEEDLSIEITVESLLDDGSKTMNSQGKLVISGVTLHKESYVFKDESGESVKGAQPFVIIYPSFSSTPDFIGYKMYHATTGDLGSYFQSEWKSKKRGNKYTEEFLGDIDNAITINENTYIQNTWASDGSVISKFKKTDTNSIKHTWTFDKGVYGSASVELMGASAKFSVSMDSSTSDSTSNEEGTGWNLTMSVDNLKYSECEPNALSHYVYRAYMLKPSTEWTNELLSHDKDLRKTIDPNSEPWKIIYVVDEDSVERNSEDSKCPSE